MASAEEFKSRLRNRHRNRVRSEMPLAYKISSDGENAVFLVGKFKGHMVHAIARNKSGVEYLRWVIEKSNFGDDLKDVCRFVLNEKGLG